MVILQLLLSSMYSQPYMWANVHVGPIWILKWAGLYCFYTLPQIDAEFGKASIC